MGASPQALEIIFEVQMKRNNEKIARRKNKLFNSQTVV
jgi:ribosome-associated protein YbcJ (S4-like RNA binding protein)